MAAALPFTPFIQPADKFGFHPAIVQPAFLFATVYGTHRQCGLQRHCLFVGGRYSLSRVMLGCAFYFPMLSPGDNQLFP